MSGTPSHPTPYSIKRHGTTLESCDHEPVQTPGCIQPHGTLLMVRASDLIILQVAENCHRWLGREPAALLNLPLAELWDHWSILRLKAALAEEALERNPTYLFTLSPLYAPARLDVMVHTLAGKVILEFEETNRTGPLADDGGGPDYYYLVKKALPRIHAAATLREAAQAAAEEIRRITGLDRLMVYRFHADDSGEIFAESRREDLPSWQGWRYPAADIPKPAREIFKRIWVRPVPDVDAELVEIVPLANPDDGSALDMTHCALRGASVMYTEYLRNMGVAASLTMPVRRESDLWGMFAGHHYSPRLFPYKTRAAAEFLAQICSMHFKTVEEREFQAYRQQISGVHYQLVNQVASTGQWKRLTQGKPSLLGGIKAGGAAVLEGDAVHTCGQTPKPAELAALAVWLKKQPELKSKTNAVLALDCLSARYAPAEKFAGVASGILVSALAAKSGGLLIWFKPETIQSFSWAGNPHELKSEVGPAGPRLTPRKSFELWRETVRLRSLPWTSVERDEANKFQILASALAAAHTAGSPAKKKAR